MRLLRSLHPEGAAPRQRAPHRGARPQAAGGTAMGGGRDSMNNRKRSSSRQKKAPSTLTGEGAVFDLEPPQGGAATGRRGAKSPMKMQGLAAG